jgi:hypothetical protein
MRGVFIIIRYYLAMVLRAVVGPATKTQTAHGCRALPSNKQQCHADSMDT